jgi:hypothetical protein
LSKQEEDWRRRTTSSFSTVRMIGGFGGRQTGWMQGIFCVLRRTSSIFPRRRHILFLAADAAMPSGRREEVVSHLDRGLVGSGRGTTRRVDRPQGWSRSCESYGSFIFLLSGFFARCGRRNARGSVIVFSFTERTYDVPRSLTSLIVKIKDGPRLRRQSGIEPNSFVGRCNPS